jgi:hypothetical protein
MKAGWLILGLVLSGATRTIAQQQVYTNHFTAGTNAVEVPSTEPSLFQLTQPSDTNASVHVVLKTKIRVSGPLVGPAKAKTASDFSRKVAHLFSPFASEEFNPQSAPSGPVNARAWSAIVGWHPGGSAFPTESQHEPPELRLLSISAEKEP